jgi:hypothetical protein
VSQFVDSRGKRIVVVFFVSLDSSVDKSLVEEADDTKTRKRNKSLRE